MKKISKILSIALCLTLVLALLPLGASATTEKYVEFTVDSLGLATESYTADTNTVDGVGVEWIQLGNYAKGGGIQMRDKDGKTSMFWNTSAFAGGITKIELTYSDIQDVKYANTDAVIFNFGNEAKGTDYSTKLSTTAGVKTYTITPDADTYTYFYMEHDLGYTFYWKSIKVYYNEAESGGDEPEVTTNYYVTGSTEIFGNWAPLNESGLMTKGEDGLYTKVYENVPAADYELKVNIGNWDTSWGDNGNNYKFTVEAVSTVTVTFDAEAGTVSVDVVANVVEEPEEPTIVDIATALAGEDGAEFTVKGVVVCIEGGKNVYIQDATGGICVRTSDTPADLTLGYTITATGTKGAYNGLPQLNNSTYVADYTAQELPAKETTIDALTTADVCTYVKLSGVTVTEVFDNDGAYTSPNITVTDGTNTIQIYKAVVDKNEDGSWAIQVGDKLNVTAAVGIYAKNDNVTLQLRNTLADEITVVTEENPGEGENPGEENPGTGDMSVAGLVVAMMAATAGVVVLKKKEF